jgi:hypothetical protein
VQQITAAFPDVTRDIDKLGEKAHSYRDQARRGAGMMNPGMFSTGIAGTREHVGTPKSYLPIYNTIFLYTLIFQSKNI